MSKGATRLSLGPLRSTATSRLTVVLPSTLKDSLERYAALHTQIYGEPVSVEGLIPHMLEAFVQRDRGFRKPAGQAGRRVAARGPARRGDDEPDTSGGAQRS
jgi:hypothetical protein